MVAFFDTQFLEFAANQVQVKWLADVVVTAGQDTGNNSFFIPLGTGHQNFGLVRLINIEFFFSTPDGG